MVCFLLLFGRTTLDVFLLTYIQAALIPWFKAESGVVSGGPLATKVAGRDDAGLSYDCPEGGSPRAGGDGVGVGVGAREPQGG